MIIYKLELSLMEKVFFASREISNFFITEPVIGNYALVYAFGFMNAPYHIDSIKNETPNYLWDLRSINEMGIYITPATPIDGVELELERFNGLSDSYWYMMSNNIVAASLEYKLTKKTARPANFPQQGRLRLLLRGNKFTCFIISNQEIHIPSYIRLGKFNSKTKVDIKKVYTDPIAIKKDEASVDIYLNPLDLPPESNLKLYDLFNIPPVPLISNALIEGNFYYLDGIFLPSGLRFGIPRVQEKTSRKKNEH
ncbi:type I-D CRISPR-associated protein Cas5/Csc1 [Methylacidiphilum caldifontis]|uniref:type I-D CRISPR-associated protein Cas5/Csc1 n=1 Tax=Methylacidiphilum caldifontis TaxID=2795386 RepID=UPI001A8E159A|nr:type I-D CRISPR-associated protein Cas5/Csc1 [Methylacidiphilum caldifontis]QSR87923.1 type I-D CRISPR-associated protein Cas5/Csc1 [Methylacidiphilum caldifontis]